MGERGPKSQFTNISCTNPKCRLYGKAGEGNIVGNGTHMACGQISQKYICRECGHYFNSRTDTAYGGLRSEADKFDLAIKCINEGMGVRATARTVGCSVSTVQRWTLGAAAQAAAVSGSFERNLEPAGMQFDEMSGTLKKLKFGGEQFTSEGLWIWMCMDPYSKFLLGMHPDECGIEVGHEFVGKMIRKLKDRFSPVYMTDGYRVYNEVFLQVMVEWSLAEYGGRGRPPVPKFGYSRRFNYCQVIKTRQCKKLEKVEYKIVSGNVPKDAFNTSSIERMNLTIRNGMARLKRICQTFSKSLVFLKGGCGLFKAIYNFCRPHMALNEPDCKITPAMQMGITDGVWSLRKLMTFSYKQNIS